jgi:hypothetical protein
MPPKNIFIARYNQFEVRMEVPESVPMDTPENRRLLVDRLGRMMAAAIEPEITFTSE